MSDPVNRRRYESPKRRASAARTRAAVLGAARDRFTAQGWTGTSVTDIATLAGVSVDTVYATVGRKAELLVAVHDMALSGGDEPLPGPERAYVRAVRAAPTARAKIETYAAALAEVLPRSAPLMLALRDAGHEDPECRRQHEAVAERRAANMLLLAADLRATGEVRPDLTDDWVADLIWSMNSPEYFLLVTSRGLGPSDYAALVTEVWCRSLLSNP